MLLLCSWGALRRPSSLLVSSMRAPLRSLSCTSPRREGEGVTVGGVTYPRDKLTNVTPRILEHLDR